FLYRAGEHELNFVASHPCAFGMSLSLWQQTLSLKQNTGVGGLQLKANSYSYVQVCDARNDHQ
ncbi:MAG TPA: hypothetical protein PLA68_18530, partial [Panacibacter sp.]|nr:hypothetical protein [Panacibacter sp.]